MAMIIAVAARRAGSSSACARRRCRGAPTSAAPIGSTLVVLVLSSLLLIVVGVLLFGAHVPGGRLPGLVATLVLGTAAFTALGIGAARSSPTPRAAPVVLNCSSCR